MKCYCQNIFKHIVLVHLGNGGLNQLRTILVIEKLANQDFYQKNVILRWIYNLELISEFILRRFLKPQKCLFAKAEKRTFGLFFHSTSPSYLEPKKRFSFFRQNQLLP